MSGVRNPLALMRRAALPALGVLVIANFVGYAVAGDNGVLAWGDYRRIKSERKEELTQLQTERARLAHRSQLLDPRRTDPDLAEELVRRELGLIRPDEVIIDMGDQNTATPAAGQDRRAR